MSKVLYFSKVNLNSSHIFKAYENKDVMNQVANDIYSYINEVATFTRNDFDSETGNLLYSAEFSFVGLEKELPTTFPHLAIAGGILKKAPVYVNEQSKKKKSTLIRKEVMNNEIIQFYYDIAQEKVVFHTCNRFGYAEFVVAFNALLNQCLQVKNSEYFFDVSIIKDGTSLVDLKKRLKEFGNIQSLIVKVIPPNPDDDILDNIQKNAEEYLNNMKEANVTEIQSMYYSNTSKGIDVESKLIDDKLNEIEKIHSQLPTEKSTELGYVSVEAENIQGGIYTTEQNTPKKAKIGRNKPKALLDFAEICKTKLVSVFQSR